MAKVQISVDDELLKRIDNYADKHYQTRSGFITLASSQFLDTHAVTSAIVDMAVSIRKVADTGVLDEETQEQMNDFMRLASVLSNR